MTLKEQFWKFASTIQIPSKDEGHIIVDSIEPIAITDVTNDLARESGFENVDDLMGIAKHGSGDNVYLVRFHYMPPGAVEYIEVETSPEDGSG